MEINRIINMNKFTKYTIPFLLISFGIFSEGNSMWVDSNPYSTGQQGLQVGAIVRVILKDGIKAEYTYEAGKDETITIKSAPDKKSIPEIMGYNMDRTIAGKKNGKEKSNSKIKEIYYTDGELL